MADSLPIYQSISLVKCFFLKLQSKQKEIGVINKSIASLFEKMPNFLILLACLRLFSPKESRGKDRGVKFSCKLHIAVPSDYSIFSVIMTRFFTLNILALTLCNGIHFDMTLSTRQHFLPVTSPVNYLSMHEACRQCHKILLSFCL